MTPNQKSRRSLLKQALCGALALASFSTGLIASDQVPGAKQSKPIVIQGATVYTVVGEPIQNGTVIFNDGKIAGVGVGLPIPEGAEVIDGTGKRVYPGLFDSYSHIGLIEIESVRATIDTTETGDINSNVRSQVAINPDSELIPVTRANGVLLGLSAPTGGLIAGRSCIVQLDGWTWEEMTLQPDVGMHVRWPRSTPAFGFANRETPETQRRNRESQIDRLQEFVEQTRAYITARKERPDQNQIDARFEGMIPVVEGKIPIIAEAEDRGQIQSAVAFAKQHRLKLIILGGYDAESCAALLREAQVPVVVGGVYRVPQRASDDYDASYTLPARLAQAGVKFSIGGVDRFGGSNLRNLPYHAGTAVAYGLSPEQALRAITLSPAEIYGVSDRVGSLEVGKHATLFIADGDILETPTHVTHAFVAGKKVDLGSRHESLYHKYKEKYDRIKAAK